MFGVFRLPKINNIQSVGKYNRIAVFEYLFKNGDASMHDISEFLSLSFPAVTRAIEAGLELHLVESRGIQQSDRGRKAQLYGIDPDYGHSASLYIDSTSIIIELRNMRSDKLKTARVKVGKKNVIGLIDEIIDDILEFDGKIQFIFVIVAGDVYQGKIITCRNYEELVGFDMQSHLTKKFSGIVIVENDMTACTNSCFRHNGSMKGRIILTYLFGKNDYGAGAIVNNGILLGSTGRGFRLGELPIEKINTHSINFLSKQLQSLIAVFNPDTVILYPTDDDLSYEDMVSAIKNQLSEELFPEFRHGLSFIDDCIDGMCKFCFDKIKKQF